MQAAPDPPAGSPLLLPQRTGAPCFFPELRGRRQFVPAAVPTAPQWGIGATHLGAARERPTTHTHTHTLSRGDQRGQNVSTVLKNPHAVSLSTRAHACTPHTHTHTHTATHTQRHTATHAATHMQRPIHTCADTHMQQHTHTHDTYNLEKEKYVESD